VLWVRRRRQPAPRPPLLAPPGAWSASWRGSGGPGEGAGAAPPGATDHHSAAPATEIGWVGAEAARRGGTGGGGTPPTGASDAARSAAGAAHDRGASSCGLRVRPPPLPTRDISRDSPRLPGPGLSRPVPGPDAPQPDKDRARLCQHQTFRGIPHAFQGRACPGPFPAPRLHNPIRIELAFASTRHFARFPTPSRAGLVPARSRPQGSTTR